MRTDNKAFWQRFAKLYGPVMERSGVKLYRDICERIRPCLKRDMDVLELACGTGQLSYPLSSRVRVRLMELVGFRTYHKWDAGAFVEYLSAHGFAIFDQAVLGGSLALLCCAVAKKKSNTGKSA